MTTDLRALVERVRNSLEAHRNGLPDDWQDFMAEQVRDLNAAMQAALDAQAGMVMVPVASTSAMDWAGVDAAEREHYIIPSEVAERIWDAMLAAAPAGPVEGGGG